LRKFNSDISREKSREKGKIVTIPESDTDAILFHT
jgi:hypothetical protein